MNMKIVAIDPGPTESCYCVVDLVPEFRFHYARMAPNDELLQTMLSFGRDVHCIVIEGIASYGMAVGREVFDTVFWSGRFYQRAIGMAINPDVIYRRDVKLTLCGSAKAKDGNIRTRLMDVFGGSRAKGTKKQPGPLFGLASHGWAALALALTFRELRGFGTVDALAAHYREDTWPRSSPTNDGSNTSLDFSPASSPKPS